MKDLKNKKFGKLVVVEYCKPSESSKGKHYWTCKCECGKISVIRDSHLLYSNTKSCGCLKKRRGKDSPFFKGCGEIHLDYFSIIRRSATSGKRKIKKFSITIEYIWKLFLKQNRKCAISGIELTFDGTRKENKIKETNKTTASLDRIDSSLGYIKGNVQWVHKQVNLMKNSTNQSDFINFCKIISKHNE